MAEFPLLKMINVLERQVPFAYPQHGTLSRGYVETGEENPLPSKDELVNKTLTELKETLELQELKVKDVKITNAIEVSNLPETQKVEVTNQKESQDVEVTNQPEDYPDSAVKAELEAIKGTQSEIISALQTTNEHLDSVIKDDRLQSDTQVIGSNLEDSLPVRDTKRKELIAKINDVSVAGGSRLSIEEGVNTEDYTKLIALGRSEDSHKWRVLFELYATRGNSRIWLGEKSLVDSESKIVIGEWLDNPSERANFTLHNQSDIEQTYQAVNVMGGN